MKKDDLLVAIFYSFIFSILILLLNVKFLISDEKFYYKEFEKYNVYSKLNGYEADNINRETFDFLSGKKNSPPENFFSDREIKHLMDVRRLFQIMDFVIFLSVALLCCFVVVHYFAYRDLRKLMKLFSAAVVGGSILVIAFSIFLFASVKMNFDVSFGGFHQMFFPEGSYLFNPLNEKIVLLYPEGLFSDAAVGILLRSFISSVLLILLCVVLLKAVKRKYL